MSTDFVAQKERFFELEARVLSEKAKGLSDLEIASKLLLYESTVRGIVWRRKSRLSSGRDCRDSF